MSDGLFSDSQSLMSSERDKLRRPIIVESVSESRNALSSGYLCSNVENPPTTQEEIKSYVRKKGLKINNIQVTIYRTEKLRRKRYLRI